VGRVNLHDAVEFCRRLIQRTGKSYGLPSEAQWEYACRAGTATSFHFGATVKAELANYESTTYGDGSKGTSRRQTTEVASYPEKPGIYMTSTATSRNFVSTTAMQAFRRPRSMGARGWIAMLTRMATVCSGAAH
jgi:hypothetical protein